MCFLSSIFASTINIGFFQSISLFIYKLFCTHNHIAYAVLGNPYVTTLFKLLMKGTIGIGPLIILILLQSCTPAGIPGCEINQCEEYDPQLCMCSWCYEYVLQCKEYSLESCSCQECNFGQYGESGYYIDDYGTCSQCIDHCELCANSTSCDFPTQGYFFNDLTSEVDLCAEYLTACTICNQSDVCDECGLGYTIYESTTCQNCLPNCAVCAGASCGTCDTGYYVNEQSRCSQCMTGCDICDDVATCTYQHEGYYLDGGSSLPCMTNCKTCSDNATCSVCYDYYFVNGSNVC